ncbi:unnamed protein product [Lota lota]
MSETLITGQTSEDLLADFETLLNSGSIDLHGDHQIVIISSPSNVGLHASVAPTSTGRFCCLRPHRGLLTWVSKTRDGRRWEDPR